MWGKIIQREGATLAPPQAKSSHFAEEQLSAHAGALPTPPRMTASVGKTMRLLGEIRSDEDLYFDGELEGTLEVSGRLTIGPSGKLKANVRARDLVVAGSIQGGVEAAGRIVIMNGASIVGDIKTAGIEIEDGAFFKARHRHSLRAEPST